jgi:hypothetical protein
MGLFPRDHMKSAGGVSCLCLCIMFGSAALAGGRTPAPVEIVCPVTDAQGHVVEAAAPDGKPYPLFRQPPESPLLTKIREVLRSGPAQQQLALEHFARTLRSYEGNAAHGESQPGSLAPMYLLLSNEEGGFARYGFWMERANGRRELVMAGYVDLVVSQEGVDSGGLPPWRVIPAFPWRSRSSTLTPSSSRKKPGRCMTSSCPPHMG